MSIVDGWNLDTQIWMCKYQMTFSYTYYSSTTTSYSGQCDLWQASESLYLLTNLEIEGILWRNVDKQPISNHGETKISGTFANISKNIDSELYILLIIFRYLWPTIGIPVLMNSIGELIIDFQ